MASLSSGASVLACFLVSIQTRGSQRTDGPQQSIQHIPCMWALSNLKILGQGLEINVPTEATGSTETDGATEWLLRLGTGIS